MHSDIHRDWLQHEGAALTQHSPVGRKYLLRARSARVACRHLPLNPTLPGTCMAQSLAASLPKSEMHVQTVGQPASLLRCQLWRLSSRLPPFPSGGSCSAGWPHLWAAGSSRSRFSSICLWPRGLNPSPTTYCLVCLWCGDDGDAECGMRAAGGGRRVFTYRASAALAHRHWAVPRRHRTPGESLPPPHAASGTAAHRVPQAPSLAAGIDASSG